MFLHFISQKNKLAKEFFRETVQISPHPAVVITYNKNKDLFSIDKSNMNFLQEFKTDKQEIVLADTTQLQLNDKNTIINNNNCVNNNINALPNNNNNNSNLCLQID
jgi:hypothetical protein